MGRKREDRAGMAPLRHCHDCGKPTRNYRCEKCHRQWRARWAQSMEPQQAEMDAGLTTDGRQVVEEASVVEDARHETAFEFSYPF